MRTIFAEYNPQRNSIDVYTSAGYMLRIDCWEAEKNLKTTPGSDCALNALAIDEPLEYARLYLDGTMQMWVDAEDSLDPLRKNSRYLCLYVHLNCFFLHLCVPAFQNLFYIHHTETPYSAYCKLPTTYPCPPQIFVSNVDNKSTLSYSA
jgi:hypothetical protein